MTDNRNHLDSIILKLVKLRYEPPGTRSGITESEIIELCISVRKILLKQPSLLRLEAPVVICGDIHGEFYDLLRIFETMKYPPATNYLFLGDFVDRGKQAIDVVALLFAFKIKFPNNFFLLRGNHENWKTNYHYGFLEECILNYSEKIWKIINEVFRCLPFAAIIDDQIFCVHGGISTSINSLEEIEDIKRPKDVSSHGIIANFLWSDPNANLLDGNWIPSDRGIGILFGPVATSRFCQKFGFSLIVRAHEVAPQGYNFPFQNDKSILTIYSSSSSSESKGAAVLSISEDLQCTIISLPKFEIEVQNEPIRTE
ncbi:Ser/Thr protein phosphatase, putative [Trichomonas vaginalis G3]|uniref:Serine/threonine-protein phosphatase n=1 Tax=Trichomonas vaginalis (strain ATCC PRA-98 / G3) TaxID=412133 RepID=A2FFL0_TRIV3|nr:phosphoprotein phosphatase protein [Trichomonas vaginalis G3]EAX96289.1 Ser/Thr protein phosphatase, putative [Trichomonas vaginalis G3]KAI5491275.1 phosphoprotein phosphatase protein [Trichomonas vaginalis G3]|eukprot:XP_001309219.1 Ser/Thr protein phosphatase [Trichomonas vaginalis G3]